jgi:ribosomal protein S18 acetylase RimI-like enzyme
MIVPYEAKHRKALVEICWRTGFYGKDLTGTDLFSDKELFALNFCLHYTEFSPDLCFMALDEANKAVGYILGTTDTAAQKADFAKKMIPRIGRHLLFNTFWTSREDYLKARAWSKNRKRPRLDDELLRDYPAHLHINLLPGFQGQGHGSQLMAKFLGELRSRGVKGVHLGTNSANEKAVPFYKKMGFTVLDEKPGDMWGAGGDLKSLVFGLKL